jgi:biotin synthase-like enzyme
VTRSQVDVLGLARTWEERYDTLRMVREAGMEVSCGGIVGMRGRWLSVLSSRRSSPRWTP